MLTSMTGYGRATLSNGTHTVTVEMKSVNHRYLEMTFNTPRSLLHLEDDMKRCIKNVLHRGSITVLLTISGESLNETTLHVNWDLLDQYIEKLKTISDRYGLEIQHHLQDINQFNDVFTVIEKPKQTSSIDALILSTLNAALDHHKAMRLKEGQHLYYDLKERLSEVDKCVKKIHEYAPKVVETYRNRLENRILDFLNGRALVDEERLLNEVAGFAEKVNIDEELTRLSSHSEQFRAFLEESGPVGRKMDFLIQEMNRETNTIGSKANDIHIAREVVEIKSHIEKIREQIQNIE
ncbi:uncharacterized protein (TIGR00255 family) [Pullulanibacillus pueri]|uniref:YicC family protein n=1 Tax=Pullulanibacillus pueri TaxID=1437324 RepID=A0A8J2ZRV8_9BACL|nr:YicC/YloC family endoribonuclease [Pullulanibacillus pueri]MBM7680175.1 uncharacterized protein (TIGR00255 family) [Pullulanibacillus pueri]GGH74732.1 hypothetical protein GCM10007096_03240 [Pullulanibacillus pueri]